MKTLVLFGFMAAPFVLGGLAVGNTEGAVNFCAVMLLSLLMTRETARICLLLMRRWQMFEHETMLTSLLPTHLIEAELRPVRLKSDIYRRDIYHRR